MKVIFKITFKKKTLWVEKERIGRNIKVAIPLSKMLRTRNVSNLEFFNQMNELIYLVILYEWYFAWLHVWHNVHAWCLWWSERRIMSSRTTAPDSHEWPGAGNRDQNQDLCKSSQCFPAVSPVPVWIYFLILEYLYMHNEKAWKWVTSLSAKWRGRLFPCLLYFTLQCWGFQPGTCTG